MQEERANESTGSNGGATAGPPPMSPLPAPAQPPYPRRVDPVGQFLTMSAADLKRLPRATKIELLRDLRHRPLRCPQLVSLCVTELVGSGTGGDDLHDERWVVLEQGVWAALECGRTDTAQDYFSVLKGKFGAKSLRIRRLAGIIREGQGQFARAQEIYKGILVDCPSDSFVAKRLSAMHKANGEYAEAIACLESRPLFVDTVDGQTFTFLDLYRGSDEGAMRELVSLHFLVGRMDRALFYAEEVILLDPHNFVNHTRHAELCYAAGFLERAAAAFAHSLRLNDSENNARAMYGLWITALMLQRQSYPRSASSSTVQLKDVKGLQMVAAAKLKSLYTESPQYSRLTLLLQCHP